MAVGAILYFKNGGIGHAFYFRVSVCISIPNLMRIHPLLSKALWCSPRWHPPSWILVRWNIIGCVI